MKQIIFLLILLFSTQGFSAKESQTLEMIRSQLAKYKQVNGSFKQVREIKDLKMNIESSGTFEFKIPLELKWNQDKPFRLSIFMEPEKIVQKNTDGTEQVMTKSQQPVVFMFSSSFLGIFSGDEKLLHQNFTYKATQKEKNWNLILKPRDDLMKKAIQQVEVHGREYISSVVITETSGHKTTITFSDVKDHK